MSFSNQDYTAERASGTVRVSISGYQSDQKPGYPELPTKYFKYHVISGRLDSVYVIKSGAISLGNLTSNDIDLPVTTFAGTDAKTDNYYATAIRNKLTCDAPLNPASVIVDKSMYGNQEVVTLAVSPADYDPISGEITGYSNLQLEFAGSSDLKLEF
jgi:hypothetical protein